MELLQLRRVLSFGGWVLVSNSITPLLLYFDRFALGSIIGLAAVGFYTAPYEGVTRLLLVPVSLIGSLLPALSSLEAQSERERFRDLTSTSMRALMVVMAAPLAVVFVFAPELLRVWLGADYADQSGTALRILAIGVFTNALAHPLFISLYAKNRPDLPAKFHLIELVDPRPTHHRADQGIRHRRRRGGVDYARHARHVLAALGHVAYCGISSADNCGRTSRVARSRRFSCCSSRCLPASLSLTCRSSPQSQGVIMATTAFSVASWSWILRDAERLAIARTLGTYRRGLLPLS